MVTVKFSSSPPSLEEDTQGENVSAVINFGRTGGYLDQQSAHNELARKHHSSRNLKRKKKTKNRRVGPLCQRDTHINSAVSSVRYGSDIRGHHWPSPGYPQTACVIFKRSPMDTKWKAPSLSLSCFSPKRQLIQPRTTKLMSFVRCNIFWIPVTHRPAPARLVFWDGTQDKRAIILMIWSPLGPDAPWDINLQHTVREHNIWADWQTDRDEVLIRSATESPHGWSDNTARWRWCLFFKKSGQKWKVTDDIYWRGTTHSASTQQVSKQFYQEIRRSCKMNVTDPTQPLE